MPVNYPDLLSLQLSLFLPHHNFREAHAKIINTTLSLKYMDILIKYRLFYGNTYILLGAFFWNTGYFLRVLKVFDESLGESNTERQVKKYQPVFQKKEPDNIFIVKFIKFTPWGKNFGVQI